MFYIIPVYTKNKVFSNNIYYIFTNSYKGVKGMKKELIPALLLSISLLSGCSLVSTGAATGEKRETVEAAYSLNLGSQKIKADHDTTAFLVGEYFVNDGTTALFDGRGSMTVFSPDGSSVAGYYAMTEKNIGDATVSINTGSGDVSYRYQLISSDGGFTLTDAHGELLVFVLKNYS